MLLHYFFSWDAQLFLDLAQQTISFRFSQNHMDTHTTKAEKLLKPHNKIIYEHTFRSQHEISVENLIKMHSYIVMLCGDMQQDNLSKQVASATDSALAVIFLSHRLLWLLIVFIQWRINGGKSWEKLSHGDR